jgi:aspartate ammonia-lyase
MKILLEIKDNKAEFFMELLRSLSFVKKATTISNEKAQQIEDIKEAVEELKVVKEGKIKARNVDDLINEL